MAVAMAALGLVAPGSAKASATFGDAAGIHVVSVRQVDDRQYDVAVLPAALGRQVDVRVLVPADYDQDPTIRYPVLYLFHGTSGRASDWVNSGDAEASTQGLPLIVVMPDAGFNGNGGGWFTNWVDTHTVLGPSQWETFHVDELIPWIDANLRTFAQREGRSVAGLSQGGFGSTTYPARHPDMFVSAASFSGAPDIDYNPPVAAGATAIIEATAVGLDGVQPDAMFGSRITNEVNWQGHDPAQLAPNLRGVSVWLYTATGFPGPLDPPAPNLAAMGIEGATHGSTMSFWQRLQSLGIPSHLDDYVLGTHTWPYWARDLREFVGPMMQIFADPPSPPAKVAYQSIDQHWSQWGWTVSLQRAQAQEFTWLSDADAQGFALRGSGTGTVTTPAFYTPGSTQLVTLSDVTGPSSFVAQADSGGRLQLTVPLGPAAAPAVVGVPAELPPGSTTVVTVEPASP
jgi:S-formylglutathione hydrolase FrmB